MNQSSILAVDDNKSVLKALELLLAGRCKKLKTLSSPNMLLSELSNESYDLLLLDMNFSSGINSGNEGIYWLQTVLAKYPSMSVLMITAYGDISLAVKAVRLGALDFITKPWDNQKMLDTVASACRFSFTRKSASPKINPNRGQGGNGFMQSNSFEGESSAWKKIMHMVNKVADTQANVLITGENGTGKEIVASRIHQLSARKNLPMIKVDMGAIVESLFESELFGHKKGSFTDARADRKGKIEEACGGTLFLDEIGNLPFPLQSRLLSVLQNRVVTRLGENMPVPVDIRLVCATNDNLTQRIENGSFREDLLYRINTIHIDLPPLRHRKEDIPGFAAHFLQKYVLQYHKPEMHISDQAMALLCDYNWPGNVRELQHAIEKAVILSDNRIIRPADFMFKQYENQESNAGFIGTLEEMERKLIADAIIRFEGNLTSVAAQLGITRQTLYNKIKKYGL